MKCGAQSGLKLSISFSSVLSNKVGMKCGAQSGLKLRFHLYFLTLAIKVGMKCGAQSGLKPWYMELQHWQLPSRNEVWCPVGIETAIPSHRHFSNHRRNEVWCPVGIETPIPALQAEHS